MSEKNERYFTVNFQALDFETHDAAKAFEGALHDVFVAMPQAEGIAISSRVVEEPAVTKTSDPDLAPGLTKREYAAIHIAAGMAARGLVFSDERNDATMAVAMADAVLKEAGE